MLEILATLGLGLSACALPLAFVKYVNLRVKNAENLAGKPVEQEVNWKNPA